MLFRLSQLHGMPKIDKIVIHSIEQSLYQASIVLDNNEYYIADNKGDLLRTFNLLKMQKHFRGITYKEMVLRHESAYDEMIGQASKIRGQNRLEVTITDNGLS